MFFTVICQILLLVVKLPLKLRFLPYVVGLKERKKEFQEGLRNQSRLARKLPCTQNMMDVNCDTLSQNKRVTLAKRLLTRWRNAYYFLNSKSLRWKRSSETEKKVEWSFFRFSFHIKKEYSPAAKNNSISNRIFWIFSFCNIWQPEKYLHIIKYFYKFCFHVRNLCYISNKYLHKY